MWGRQRNSPLKSLASAMCSVVPRSARQPKWSVCWVVGVASLCVYSTHTTEIRNSALSFVVVGIFLVFWGYSSVLGLAHTSVHGIVA